MLFFRFVSGGDAEQETFGTMPFLCLGSTLFELREHYKEVPVVLMLKRAGVSPSCMLDAMNNLCPTKLLGSNTCTPTILLIISFSLDPKLESAKAAALVMKGRKMEKRRRTKEQSLTFSNKLLLTNIYFKKGNHICPYLSEKVEFCT